MTTIKSVRPFSLAKILAFIYASLGLIFGVIFAGISLVGGIAPMADGNGAPAIVSMMMGGGAIIVLPLFYGVFGFIGGLIIGAIYNFVAKMVGGLELEIE